MSEAAVSTKSASRIAPKRRSDLVVKPLANAGEFVVKDPKNGRYFNLPAQESYLFTQLDGQTSIEDICASFEKEFDEPLSKEDFQEFISLVDYQGFLQKQSKPESTSNTAKPSYSFLQSFKSILYWRVSLFDPDQLFTWLAPRISFFWTPAFFLLSLTAILSAGLLLWSNGQDYFNYLPESWGWETLVLGWFLLILLTALHEFAHGLTCKYFGGEVHEVGFLLMFFIPCFYCNVSDTWLFHRKSQRLWVMLAGSYLDLCMWALAVFFWRVTLPHTLPFQVAYIVLTICGGRILFNFNPLMKLDGYYLLSDWLEIPNLRSESQEYVASRLRWLLWGAPYPKATSRGVLLLGFGLASWFFAAIYLSLMYYTIFHYLSNSVGWFTAVVALTILAWIAVPGMFQGIAAGEVRNMIYKRWIRTALWFLAFAIGGAVIYWIPCDDSVTGNFKTRSTQRAEVRAPINGFLKLVKHDEGEQVSSKTLLAVLEIPDLSSRLAQKRAEEREVESKLRLLSSGNRPEQIAEQRMKVTRAKEWLERAQQDLTRKKAVMQEELHRHSKMITQAQTNLYYNRSAYERAKPLADRGALARDTLFELERQYQVAKDQLAATEAQRRERQTLGTLENENELARRGKELADEQSTLSLLEVGARPEELEAEKARLSRIQEELQYLNQIQEKLQILSPVSGLVITPHLREKIGQYFKEGDIICEIEDPHSLEIEIPLEEQDVRRVEPGMSILLKPRATPLQSLKARVERIAPQAVAGKIQSTINVYAKLDQSSPELASNMTGYARIICGSSTLTSYLSQRVLRYLRTEIWW